jgi:hypothetical protein
MGYDHGSDFHGRGRRFSPINDEKRQKMAFEETCIELLKPADPAVTRATEKETQNRIIGLICPFLPPRVFVKCPSIRKMDGRSGGDRNCIPIQ